MKKLFSVLLIAAMILSMPISVSASDFTTADALAILRHVAGIAPLSEEELEKYDVNGDGMIDSADALFILQVAAGVRNPDGTLVPVVVRHGNTSGNILNGSFAAIKGDWIYYIGTDDVLRGNVLSMNEYILYKIRTDSTGKTELFQSFSFSATDKEGHTWLLELENINVIGDWIYMSHTPFGISRIRTDGTRHTLLTNEDSCRYVTVVGDWIYYTKDELIHPNTDNWDTDQSIYRIRTDGTGKTRVVERIHVFDSSILGYPKINFSISDDWIYYTTGDSFNPSLYRVRTNGTERTKLLENKHIDGGSLNVVGDWIYFSDMVFGGSLYKMRTDGTELTGIASGFNGTNLNVSGDWIYYISHDGSNFCIYRMSINGTGMTKLREVPGLYNHEINVVGDWIFYRLNRDTYMMRTDGTGHQQMS